MSIIELQLLIHFYKQEVKREATLANVALLERARNKFMEMKDDKVVKKVSRRDNIASDDCIIF